MRTSRLKKLQMLGLGVLLMVIFQVMPSFAQGQTPSGSAATSTNKAAPSPTPPLTPSDIEIRKTLVRALDKVEAQNEAIKAKDGVIDAQEEAIKSAEKAVELRAQEAAANLRAYNTERDAHAVTKEGWKAEEKRTRELEKKVRNSSSRTKWIALGAIAAVVTTVLLK